MKEEKNLIKKNKNKLNIWINIEKYFLNIKTKLIKKRGIKCMHFKWYKNN